MDGFPPANQPDAASTPPEEPQRREAAASDRVMKAYVGYLAGWFDIGQLAAGRRLERAGVRAPLLSD